MSAEKLITVNGPIDPGLAGVTDAHNHLWISPNDEAASSTLTLNDFGLIASELSDYQKAGGGTIIDCQPGGSGRDGRKLRDLALLSRVNIVACTGFHLREYYPPEFWIFKVSTEAAAQYFIYELTKCLEETKEYSDPVQAGYIKIACRDSLEHSPLGLIHAAAMASIETGCAIEVHTEKGADIEQIANALQEFGLSPQKLVLCHMDKRPDFELHRRLAQDGFLLEYDTFYRAKYVPEENVWPLMERMIIAGHESQIVVAADMADYRMWSRFGGQPGLTGMFSQIISRLKTIGLQDETIYKLVGGNIVSCFLRPISQMELKKEV